MSNPNTSISNSKSDKKKEEHKRDLNNYDDALKSYYTLKLTYEYNIRSSKEKIIENGEGKKTESEIRKELKAFVPQCVQCRKSGGTLFAYDKDSKTLIAKCKATSAPCNLDIRLYKGRNKDICDEMDKMEATLRQLKDEFVFYKMQHVHKYYDDEQKFAQKMRNKMDEFDKFKEGTYKSVVEQYLKYTNDKERTEKAQHLKMQIYNLTSSLKSELSEYIDARESDQSNVRSIVAQQYNLLMPDIEKLAETNNEVRYVDIHSQQKKKIEGDGSVTTEINEVVYMYSDNDKRMRVEGDKPSVVSFVGGL